MSTGFEDPIIAGRTRDVMSRLIINVLDQQRPPYKYGTVAAIYPDLRSCDVQFPGEPTPVNVSMGGIQPSHVGQVVRVDGRAADRFISDVIGQAVPTDIKPAEFAAPASTWTLHPEPEAVYAQWGAVTGASRYEIQFSDNSGFTLNVRSFTTTSRTFRLGNLNSGSTIWARVRARNATNGAGPWSTVKSAVIAEFPAGGGSDGSPPSGSPQAYVRPALGWLLVEWLPQPNADLVTYEVHISTVSGFAPSAGTKLGETTGTFYSVSNTPNGNRLAYGTTYFIRLVAKDPDGAAAPGAQGSGSPERVDTGDVGNVAGDRIGDGVAPSSSPNVGSIRAGIGYLYVQWQHISNPDPVTYEVHVSTVNNFTPTANTKVAETPSNYAFVRNQGPGASGAALVYGTTYYVKLLAKDNDGTAPTAGAQLSSAPVRTATDDLENLAVSGEKLVDGAVITAKLANLAVSTEKISADAVTTAKIAADAVTAGQLADLAVGTEHVQALAVNADKIAANAITTAKIVDGAVAAAKIAAQAVDITKFGTGLRPIRPVAALPAHPYTGYIQGDVVTLTTDGKLYRLANTTTAGTGGWTTAVPTVDLTGQVTGAQITDSAVSAAKIASDAVTAIKIATNAVTELKIAADAVTAAKIGPLAVIEGKIAANAVTVTKIADGAVQAGKIAASAVGTAHLADLAITAEKVAASAITTAKIADGAIATAKIAAEAVDITKFGAGLRPIRPVGALPAHPYTGYIQGDVVTLSTDGKLYRLANTTTAGTGGWTAAVPTVDLSGTISSTQIADGAVIAAKIGTNAVTDIKINALAVTEAKIAANAVTTAKILNGAVQTLKLADAAVSEIKVATSAITTTKIADDAITTPKLVANAVVADKIAADAVVAGKIAANAVTAGTIAALAVTAGTIAANVVTATEIAAGTITATEIASNAITAIKINASAVTSDKINAGAVTAVKITAGAVETDKLAANAVTAAKIAALTITAAEIAANAITADKITANAITTAKINAGAVTANEIAANAVIADKIAANAVVAGKIAADAVTAGTIAAGAVTTAKLDALAVTADKIAANTITAAKIAANTITATQIAATTITAAEIAANAITTAKINAGAVTAAEIATNAITAVKISAGAVVADKIATNAVTAIKIMAGAVTADKITADWLVGNKLVIGGDTTFANGYDPTTKATPEEVLAAQLAGGWEREYTVRTIAPTPLLHPDGSLLDSAYTYEVEARVLATGTNTSAVAVFVHNGAGAFTLEKIQENGIGSNHPEFFLDNGVPSIRLYNHTSFYPVAVTHRRVRSRATAGTSLPLLWRHANTTFIDGGNIFTNSVTANQIAANTITATQIAATTITAAEIATNAVTADKIIANAVTTAKINTGAVTANEIAANAVVADKIAANAVTVGKINAGAVTAGTIAAGAVTAGTIAANAVTATEIAAGTITATEIASNAVTAVKIAANAVVAGKIAANAVTAATIAAGQVTAGKIAANAVTATEIAANTITAAQIAANTVTAAEIAALTITGNEIAANTIAATKISSYHLSTTNATIDNAVIKTAMIEDAAISQAKIENLNVTEAKIASLAVSTAKIQDLAVGTAKIANLAVSTAKIADLAVDNAKIANATIQSAKIVSLVADKIETGIISGKDIQIAGGTSGRLRTQGFVPGTSTTGWELRADGQFWARNADLSGIITTTSGSNSATLGSGGIGFSRLVSGIWWGAGSLSALGQASIVLEAAMDGASVALTGTTATIGSNGAVDGAAWAVIRSNGSMDFNMSSEFRINRSGDTNLGNNQRLVYFNAHRGFSITRRGATASSANLALVSEVGGNFWQVDHAGSMIQEWTSGGTRFQHGMYAVGNTGQTTPAYSFDGASNWGMYYGASELRFTTAGTIAFRMTSAGHCIVVGNLTVGGLIDAGNGDILGASFSGYATGSSRAALFVTNTTTTGTEIMRLAYGGNSANWNWVFYNSGHLLHGNDGSGNGFVYQTWRQGTSTNVSYLIARDGIGLATPSDRSMIMPRNGSAAIANVNPGNSVYRPSQASAFNVSSERITKKAIKNWNRNEKGLAKDRILATPVYEYELESEPGRKTIGIMTDEAPVEIFVPAAKQRKDKTKKPEVTEEIDLIDLYPMVTVLWKAFQEMAQELDELRSRVPARP